MPREIIIALRVSKEERERAERLAAAQGMTISAYLRRCINMPKQSKPAKQPA